MKPYYQDELVTLYNTDCFKVMKSFEDEHFDVVITDPPYSERTHKNAKSNYEKGYGNSRINFDSFTEEDLFEAYDEMARLTKGWIISNIDYNHAFHFETDPPKTMRQLRIGVWVKNNPMPQISGDRPSQGWEAISYLFKKDKRASWNANGAHGNYVTNLATPTGHPTPKPLSIVSSFVERFSNLGDLILDPFAGGGTTLVAGRNLGRRVIGCEIDEKYCELIARRLSQQSFDLEGLSA
jgi:site-specific DNA-methyltransferase (adenine-specific)